MRLNVYGASPQQVGVWKQPNQYGGINTFDTEFNLPDNQTAKALNVWIEDGMLSKRWGYGKAMTATLPGKILAAHRIKYRGKIVFASGTSLYVLAEDGAAVEIKSGLTAQAGSFFEFNGKLYYINGAEYVVYDGTTCVAVTPYIPTVIINRPPAGGGDVNEDYNRLGAGFKNSFNGVASATTYQLTDTNLDATPVTAMVNGVAKVEGTDFTVNRTTGLVTKTASFGATDGQNNVVFTAYKTNQEYIDSIKKCRYAVAFGGNNDTRVFFAGNGTSTYYYTGLLDPSYWPEQQYNVVGANNDNITGFGVQYDTLIVFKPREMFAVTYGYDFNTNAAYFPCVPVSATIGCDIPGSIQLINSRLVWANTYSGAHTLASTEVREERNTPKISRNIGGDLLAEANLSAAVSADYNGKYWLCVNGNVYLWDYAISPYVVSGNEDGSAQALSWWKFSNIPASCMVQDGGLYFGSSQAGNIFKFTESGPAKHSDNGDGITAVYRVPLRDFGETRSKFSILKMFVDCRSDTHTTINVKYITDLNASGKNDLVPILVGTFSLLNFSLQTFTMQVINHKKTFVFKPHLKKVGLFGIEFSNSDIGRDMNLSAVVVHYVLNNEKK